MTHATRITDHIKDLIKEHDENGSIARQYIPSNAEEYITPEELSDPIGDEAYSPIKGIVHRYPDRVLFKISNICAAYCRYCFRKDMIGPSSESLAKKDIENALNYIRTHTDIWEVILSGGDPLILSPRRLQDLLNSIEGINHIQTLRVHTRLPLTDPKRITQQLCASLKREKALYIIIHINHVNELTPDVIAALKHLQDSGCVLLSQSVLLKDINDNATTLETLFRKLVSLRIKPYYLHHPDFAPGTSHFRLPISRGQEIMKQLQGRVSGLCLPTYMLDIPGGAGKVPLTPEYLSSDGSDQYIIEDYQGKRRAYPPK